MKTALIFFVLAALLLILFWLSVDVFLGNSTVDIHVHDTYFVIDRFQTVLFIVLFLGTFFSIGGVIGTRFRKRAFLIIFFLFLAADVYIFYPLFELI